MPNPVNVADLGGDIAPYPERDRERRNRHRHRTRERRKKLSPSTRSETQITSQSRINGTTNTDDVTEKGRGRRTSPRSTCDAHTCTYPLQSPTNTILRGNTHGNLRRMRLCTLTRSVPRSNLTQRNVPRTEELQLRPSSCHVCRGPLE